jgi:hypothetical protein
VYVFLAQPMPAMEQPEEIVAKLLPYQREFLAWAVSQERSTVRGGILADEMGMGKTLQARSQFCANLDFWLCMGAHRKTACCLIRDCGGAMHLRRVMQEATSSSYSTDSCFIGACWYLQ